MLARTAVILGCFRGASAIHLASTASAHLRRTSRSHVTAAATKPAVLWLHGLGDTGAGWQGAFGKLGSAISFHHPTAPTAPVTINGGMQCTSWMDLKTFPVDLQEPEAGEDFGRTVASVHAMLEEIEAAGTPSEQIVLGGFSQGGATSIAAGLSFPRRLGGIVSISGWAGYREDFAARVTPAALATPVLFTCGVGDPIVDYTLTKRSGELLKEVLGDGVTVLDAERYMHQPDGEEMRAVYQFMVGRLGVSV